MGRVRGGLAFESLGSLPMRESEFQLGTFQLKPYIEKTLGT